MGSSIIENTISRIKSEMKSRQISVVKLAEITGIPRTSLQRKLSGLSDLTLVESELISQAFNITLSDLLGANSAVKNSAA